MVASNPRASCRLVSFWTHVVSLRAASDPLRITLHSFGPASCHFVLATCYFGPVALSKVHRPAESTSDVVVQCLYR